MVRNGVKILHIELLVLLDHTAASPVTWYSSFTASRVRKKIQKGMILHRLIKIEPTRPLYGVYIGCIYTVHTIYIFRSPCTEELQISTYICELLMSLKTQQAYFCYFFKNVLFSFTTVFPLIISYSLGLTKEYAVCLP